MRTTLILAILATGCGPVSNPEANDRNAVDRQQSQYQAAQPIPAFDWSLERDVAIQLYQARNEKVATHTVWRSDMGVIEGDCPSIGYPLPYDTSLTNPLKVMRPRLEVAVAIEQAEPNGLYPSKNSIATWIRCVTEKGEAPIYVESKVTAYPFAVVVDYATGRVSREPGASPSVVLEAR